MVKTRVEVLQSGNPGRGVVKMRTDSLPQCDAGHVMAVDSRGFYCCKPCRRYFDSWLGYFSIDRELTAVRKRRCENDGLAMFITNIGPSGVTLWECGQEGCGRKEQEESIEEEDRPTLELT